MVALLHADADIHRSRDELAGDAETEIAFLARTYLTHGLPVVVDRLGVDDDSANGADLALLWRFGTASREQGERCE